MGVALATATPSATVLAEPVPATITLTPGQCYPAAQVQAALSAERQVPIVVGNRMTTRVDRPVQYFTANARGEGYELEGDQPQGRPSTTVCVGTRFEGLRVNDINSSAIPSWALIGNDRDAALAACRTTGDRFCSSHDDYIRNATANGQRVMLVANTVFTNADGSTRNGRMITILTQVDTRLADVTATNSVGASQSVAGLENVAYTQYAGTFLAQNDSGNGRVVALASLSPRQ